jgi:hypothetical protein
MMGDNENEITPVIEYTVIARRHMERSDSVPSGPPIWLISFTDVIALMLTFFVLMYAMSDPEPEKWDKKIGITAQAEAQFSGARNEAGNSEGINLNRINYAAAENLDYLQALFSEIATDNKATQIMTIKRYAGALHIQFDNVYKPNSNQFNQDFLLFLNAFIPVLQSLDNQITLIHSGNGIRELQNIGQTLKRDGYSKPIILQTYYQDDNGENNRDFTVSLQPHDGRRITR